MDPLPVRTHCPYCSLQCGITLRDIPRSPVSRSSVQLEPQEDFPTNRGGLCSKGWTAAELLDYPDRLVTPLARDRRDAPLRPITWDDALNRVTQGIRRSQQCYGREAVGCFGGGGLTNEKAYQLGKFARVALRTSQIDYNGRFCMSCAAAATTRAFGIDRGLPFPLADIAEAKVIMLVGANPADTMPPAMQWFDEGRGRGATHITIDPRRTSTARGSKLHLQPLPGTDLALANGLLHLVIKHGYLDTGYIDARTHGFERVRRLARAYWPDRVERITGVPVAQLDEAAGLLGEAATAMILTARGAEQHSHGTDTTLAFINLALALGLPGRRGSGFATITGQGNGQGGREHGQKADQLPGYRRLDDPAARAQVAAVWGVDPESLPGPGRSAYEMLDRLGTGGGVRTLLVFASNVAVSAPHATHVSERLAGLDFLVVSDFVLSETAALADVVLPSTQWAEEEGTMTNLEGRVLRRCQALDPPPGARSDLEILCELARRLDCPASFSDKPREVFDELRAASAGGVADYAGITYERIADEDGVFWPCPDETHPGTPRLFTGRFAHPDGRARFHPVEQRGPAELPDAEYPYYLSTGRSRSHYQSGAQTRRVRALVTAEPGPYAELHPELAARAGVTAGDAVQLRSRRGAAVLRARITDTIRPDTVFVPFHWPGVNALTNPALDPASGMPEFKACAVAITAVPSG
ncbi:MAG TPA: molybdopterin oxidoreductase family protein [Pseudonocardiaceae bacterium]|nr:molybdopterin oxidoreductase family protein [Pseudonocardiaceae bacterium]